MFPQRYFNFTIFSTQIITSPILFRTKSRLIHHNKSFYQTTTLYSRTKSLSRTNLTFFHTCVSPNTSRTTLIPFGTSFNSFRTSVIPFRTLSTVSSIPQSPRIPFFGTTLSLLLAGGAPKLHLYIDSRHRTLGPIFQERIGPVTATFISSPGMMRSVFAHEGKHPVHLLPESWTLYNHLYGCSRGLFFMNGAEWHHHRKTMNKLLLRAQDTAMLTECCETVARQLVNKWRVADGTISDGLDVDLYRWSLDTIVAVLIGPKHYHEQLVRLNADLNQLALVVTDIFLQTSRLSLIPADFAAKFKIPAWRAFVSAVDSALYTANNLVNKLLDGEKSDDSLLARMQLQENMIKSDVIKIVVDLILAAGDTTAYTMQWLLYSIATRPELQRDLVTSHSLAKNCIKETLRLYPVAPFLTRILPEDCAIDKYMVPKNTLVLLSLYSSGRDEKLFKNATNYDPNRWNRGNNIDNTSVTSDTRSVTSNTKSSNSDTNSVTSNTKSVTSDSNTVSTVTCPNTTDSDYNSDCTDSSLIASTVNSDSSMMQQATMAFAMGSRSCIGRRLAEIQLQSLLLEIVTTYHVELVDGDDIEMVLKMIAVPSKSVKLKLTPRVLSNI